MAERLTVEQRERLAELEQREKRIWDEEVEFRTLSWLPGYADPSKAEAWARAAASVPYEINWRANRELWTSRPDILTHGTKVTAPTLVLHGEQDPRPPANSRRLVDILPHATFAGIPNAGHSPWIEAPTAVSTRLNAFLSTHA